MAVGAAATQFTRIQNVLGSIFNSLILGILTMEAARNS
jgi:hypothetical protein